MNKYIGETMPWVLAKSSEEADVRRLIRCIILLVCVIAVLVSPVIPVGAQRFGTNWGLV
ncbi:MAG: hypothetical protein ACLRZ2_07820 [Veillonella sp.]